MPFVRLIKVWMPEDGEVRGTLYAPHLPATGITTYVSARFSGGDILLAFWAVPDGETYHKLADMPEPPPLVPAKLDQPVGFQLGPHRYRALVSPTKFVVGRDPLDEPSK